MAKTKSDIPGSPVEATPIAFAQIARDNLMTRAYDELRDALAEGRLKPGQRIRIRELAASMGVSETPVREALMQLVRERALEMLAGRAITVARLSLDQYLELRSVRILLEGFAGEAATRHISDADIDHLQQVHEGLVAAEESGNWVEAVRANRQFHHFLFVKANLPEVLAILDGIWLRTGPLLNLLYPHARPTYSGRHQHLNVLDGLRRRDAIQVREAIRLDLLEGGEALVQMLEKMEAEERTAAAG
jgi:DNA-binding GntR family transcriptional regulator